MKKQVTKLVTDLKTLEKQLLEAEKKIKKEMVLWDTS